MIIGMITQTVLQTRYNFAITLLSLIENVERFFTPGMALMKPKKMNFNYCTTFIRFLQVKAAGFKSCLNK